MSVLIRFASGSSGLYFSYCGSHSGPLHQLDACTSLTVPPLERRSAVFSASWQKWISAPKSLILETLFCTSNVLTEYRQYSHQVTVVGAAEASSWPQSEDLLGGLVFSVPSVFLLGARILRSRSIKSCLRASISAGVCAFFPGVVLDVCLTGVFAKFLLALLFLVECIVFRLNARQGTVLF